MDERINKLYDELNTIRNFNLSVSNEPFSSTSNAVIDFILKRLCELYPDIIPF